ncbi:aminopeptidase Ey [Bemisia tabaci]|uniref:aminopeptidase Ey n=1 Tax=Bemisia tabaci TaxID=7038 RepID=UPI003B286C6D
MLRMMSHFLGKEVLRAGLIRYMKRHQYGSVMQDDLWTALTEVAHENGVLDPKTSVKAIMDPWISQTGYPVLDVKKNSDGLITVSQRMFEPERKSSDEAAKNESSLWPIPITYTTGELADFSNTKPQKWLTGRGSLAIPDLKAEDGQWIVFNLQVAALYRVNYYEENWELLRKALETEESKKKIHPLNRKQIFEDALAFGWSRDLDYKFVFSLCACLRDEADYLPLSGAYSSLRRIDLILRRTPNYGYFKSYMRKLTNPIISRSGSLVDAPVEAQAIKKQNLMADIASRYSIGNYVKQSLDLFSKWYNNENPDSINPIPKNILRQISCTAVKNGGDEEWDFLWERYLNSDSASEKSSILSALTCSRKVWTLKRYLDWSIDEFSRIPPQDSVHIFEAVAENEVGFEVAKDFFEERIPDIFTYHGADNAIMGRYIQVVADQMTSIKEYNEIKALTEKFDEYFKVSKPAVERALDTIDSNVKWHAAHYVKIPQYLAPSLRTL